MSEEVRKITAVAAEDLCQSRMNHARPTLTPRQRAQYRRVAVVVLESARKRSDATRLRAQQMPEVAAVVDPAAADVAKAAGNPIRSARLRQESATRRLIPCHEEGHLAHHVFRRSLLVLPAVAGAAAAELPTNAEGAYPRKYPHILVML